MKRTGAQLVRHALEAIGVRHTFGIPGVHNTEIYDQLAASETIRPVLVTHEAAAAFMADAVSRTSGEIGTCVIVPAAGVTCASSGIAEAFLAGIPLLVIAGGVRTDTGTRFQLHDVDQHAILRPITKGTFKVTRHQDVVPAIFDAFRLARSGEPGPVFVEVPVNLQLFTGPVEDLPAFTAGADLAPPDDAALEAAADLLVRSKRPGVFVGWGALGCHREVARIAEALAAPVATSLQGLGVFPGFHPLHVGMGFGPSAVPAATNAFAECGGMLAAGVRFGEIATGSYGSVPPAALVHLDINPQAIGANYPAAVGLVGDARRVLPRLADLVEQRVGRKTRETSGLAARIAADKAAYVKEWEGYDAKGVNPVAFFQALRRALPDDGIVVADDGNHTFLTAELLPIHRPGGFISPTDFNCMGYCVPAANAAKLVNPEADVVGIVGDGAFLMTGLEAITAATHALGVTYFVFSDGELSQISQAQQIPYNRKTCTVLGQIDVEGMAQATSAAFHRIERSADCAYVVAAALEQARTERRPVIVDVRIDYGKRTRFTAGTVATNLKRFDTATKLRFIGRALVRRVTG